LGKGVTIRERDENKRDSGSRGGRFHGTPILAPAAFTGKPRCLEGASLPL
jgi:hypothetical protein